MTRPALRWDDYRPEDRLRARLSVFRRRVEQSRRIVADWLPQVERPYVSVSGGKDSVAMLHLIQDVARDHGRPLLPILWHDSGVEYSDIPEMFERLTSMGLVPELVVVRSPEDALDLERRFLNGEVTASAVDRRVMYGPFREVELSRGFDGFAMGLRRQESAGRRWNARCRGDTYRTTSGTLRCCPLGNWEWQDVYAYGCLHSLPLHPLYSAPLMGREHRGMIRISWWSDTDHEGSFTWLRTYYPDLWERLTAAVPQVRGYA